MIKKILLVLMIGVVGYSQPLLAEEPDPFEGRLLPLELVMSFRKDIDLTREQTKVIGELVVDLQKSVAEKQWEMQAVYFDVIEELDNKNICLLYTSPSPRDREKSRMPSSA